MHLHLIFLLLIRRDISKKQYACKKIKYKKKREKMELTEMLKQALPFYVVMGLVMFWFIRLIVRSVKLHFAKKIATRYPTEQNAMKVYTNHPNAWNKLRSVWITLNESSNVSTEKKKQLKQLLMLQGLTMHYQDAKIIDNCKL